MSAARYRTKRAYEARIEDDGLRILVDRVWPPGLSRGSASLDLWMPAIAPTPALQAWFGHDPARWPLFRARYQDELRANMDATRELLALGGGGIVTLLHATRHRTRNHAVILAHHLTTAAAVARSLV